VSWGALAGCDPAIYLNLGTGLSAALVIGGQVIGGANGAAGEIGYNLRSVTDVGLALEARIPLEDMISGQALARRANSQPRRTSHQAWPGTNHARPGRNNDDTAGGNQAWPDSRPMTAPDVFEASADEPELDDLLSQFVTELAFHLVNLAICVNPVRIAVGGGLVRAWDRLRPGLEQALNAGVPFPPELVPARFPADAPLIGAVALAAEAAGAGAVIDGAPVIHPVRTLSERLPS
jgi:glucokinase